MILLTECSISFSYSEVDLKELADVAPVSGLLVLGNVISPELPLLLSILLRVVDRELQED